MLRYYTATLLSPLLLPIYATLRILPPYAYATLLLRRYGLRFSAIRLITPICVIDACAILASYIRFTAGLLIRDYERDTPLILLLPLQLMLARHGAISHY